MEIVKAEVERKIDQVCEQHSIEEFRIPPEVSVDQRVRTYLETCLSPHGFTASGIYVHDFQRILNENLPGVSPGGVTFPLGFIVVATSIGGNAISIDTSNGCVYFVSSSDVFSDDDGDFVFLAGEENPYPPATRRSVLKVMVQLANDIEQFFIDLIRGNFVGRLDSLE